MSTIGISEQMREILESVSDGVQDAVSEGMSKSPKRAASKLRSASPKNKGDYAKGWRAKRIDDNEAVVYNATHPGLTHLLENGHVIRNQSGEYGRYNGIKHIEPVEEDAAEDFFNTISEALDKITDH